tara:strand:- start:254 stop:520 length:267 start_codon:yes stop_codon:yes gene_type:complete
MRIPSRIFRDYDFKEVPFSKQELEQMFRSCQSCAVMQKQWRDQLLEGVKNKGELDEGDCEQIIHHIDTELANEVLANSIASRIAHYFP